MRKGLLVDPPSLSSHLGATTSPMSSCPGNERVLFLSWVTGCTEPVRRDRVSAMPSRAESAGPNRVSGQTLPVTPRFVRFLFGTCCFGATSFMRHPREQRGEGGTARPRERDLPGRVEEGGEMSRRESSYSSSDSEGLAGRESLATTRVRALFSARSCSFICLRV